MLVALHFSCPGVSWLLGQVLVVSVGRAPGRLVTSAVPLSDVVVVKEAAPQTNCPRFRCWVQGEVGDVYESRVRASGASGQEGKRGPRRGPPERQGSEAADECLASVLGFPVLTRFKTRPPKPPDRDKCCDNWAMLDGASRQQVGSCWAATVCPAGTRGKTLNPFINSHA